MLGSILHAKGQSGLKITIDPKKTEVIAKFPVPTTITRIKSFLGACHRTHVSSFMHVAKPLTHLTRKGIPFNWTQDCQDAFEVLKAKIVNAIELTPFDLTFPILLQMDASDYGMSCHFCSSNTFSSQAKLLNSIERSPCRSLSYRQAIL